MSMAPNRNAPPKPPESLEDAYKLIVALWHEVVGLREENAALHCRITELEEKLSTNSSNSSMAPPSDPPSREKKNRDKKDKEKHGRGGQPGCQGVSGTAYCSLLPLLP